MAVPQRRTAKRLTMLALSLSLCRVYVAGAPSTIRAAGTPPRLTIEYSGDAAVAGSPSNALGVPPTIRASATPPQLTIEYGGDVVVTGSLSNALKGAHESSTCMLTRLYASGGYGLTMEKLSPDFKKCCNLTVPATSINASAITCHIPAGLVATEGNTTITTAVGTAFIRHIAAFVPEFSRRPFVREAEGGVVARLARSLNAATIQVQIPCGGPFVNASLGGLAHDDGLSL